MNNDKAADYLRRLVDMLDNHYDVDGCVGEGGLEYVGNMPGEIIDLAYEAKHFLDKGECGFCGKPLQADGCQCRGYRVAKHATEMAGALQERENGTKGAGDD